LATSPDDKLRDGKRALKLATKAAESSGYETPHILSTLAAAYAETGDFENAAKWSQKAVELAQKAVDSAQKAIDSAKADDDRAKSKAAHDQLKKDLEKLLVDRDQLKTELESYHHHKPVRERQTGPEVAEKPPTTDHASDAGGSHPGPGARSADF